jgi:hypothetical protein
LIHDRSGSLARENGSFLTGNPGVILGVERQCHLAEACRRVGIDEPDDLHNTGKIGWEVDVVILDLVGRLDLLGVWML